MMLASCDFSISYNPSKGSSGESSITPSESTKPTPGGDVDPGGFVIHFDVKDTMDDGTYKYGSSTTPIESKISYREFYYGKDFLYTEEPSEARKGLLLGFPTREENYNNEIDSIKNDFGF